MSRRNDPEAAEQKALVFWARAAANAGYAFVGTARYELTPDQRLALSLLHHSANEGVKKGERGKAKGLGTVAGWPDLFLPYANAWPPPDERPGLFIEMKAPGRKPKRESTDPLNTLTPEQRDVRDGLLNLGYAYELCFSDLEARRVIVAYLGCTLTTPR